MVAQDDKTLFVILSQPSSVAVAVIGSLIGAATTWVLTVCRYQPALSASPLRSLFH